ncbi:unnamed protein product [Camellia sinensis]
MAKGEEENGKSQRWWEELIAKKSFTVGNLRTLI